jgi:hypothetical protein
MADGDPIPGTAISALTPGVDEYRTTFQLLNGILHQKKTGNPSAETVDVSSVRSPLGLSPLASIYLETVNEVSLSPHLLQPAP